MATQTQKRTNKTQKRQPVNSPTPLDETIVKFTLRRLARVQLSREETITRMEAFVSEREEDFVAAVRKNDSKQTIKPMQDRKC